MKTVKQYRAALYLRLSREDKDREESGSISGQRELLKQFLAFQSDIAPHTEIVDDGYSGAVFERPGFLRLMELIHKQEVDCVLVKDLSRFGRNYIETGRYLEQIFPLLGVRFIAVNDGYDSVGQAGGADSFMLPFQNLINDVYCRDISRKVKSQLQVKRLRGAFTGAFAPYGYRRSSQDREHLEPDPRAARIVRKIFRHSLEGISRAGVARLLNSAGTPPPALYRRSVGQRYYTPFAEADTSGWSAVAIGRILSDPVYIGVLRQGKTTRPDFRSTQRQAVPQENWTTVKECHPALVSRAEFDAVTRQLARDVRACPGETEKYLLSGLLICTGCGRAMVRKTVAAGVKKYLYYICASRKEDKNCGCFGAKIAAESAQTAVELLIERLVGVCGEKPANATTLKDGQEELRRRLAREQALLDGLDTDRAAGLIEEQDSRLLRAMYERRCVRLEEQLLECSDDAPAQVQTEKLRRQEISRLLAILVKQITAAPDKSIRVMLTVSACCTAEEEQNGEKKQKKITRRLRLHRGLGKVG